MTAYCVYTMKLAVENISAMPLLVVVIGVHSGLRAQRVLHPAESWHIDAATEPLRVIEQEVH